MWDPTNLFISLFVCVFVCLGRNKMSSKVKFNLICWKTGTNEKPAFHNFSTFFNPSFSFFLPFTLPFYLSLSFDNSSSFILCHIHNKSSSLCISLLLLVTLRFLLSPQRFSLVDFHSLLFRPSLTIHTHSFFLILVSKKKKTSLSLSFFLSYHLSG